jgi:glycosyltransferase involved in cell wall biosynthesis
MVIGIDGSRAFVNGRTGTENYSYQLLKALSKIDIQNSYLIYLRPEFDHPGKWPLNFKFKTLNYPRLWTQVGLSKATFEDKLDVLFVPSHTLPLVRMPGLKTVITVHDLGAEYLPGMHQLKQVLYLKLMTDYQLKTASKIISVSQATKGDLMKRAGIPSEKIEVVYEGVDQSIFKQVGNDAVNDIVKKFDLDRGKYFLFVGTIQPRKNLERLIKGFALFVKSQNLKTGPAAPVSRRMSSVASFPAGMRQEPSSASPLFTNKTLNFKLVLVGKKGWKSDAIYNLPKELGIGDWVRFLPPEEGHAGRISDEDLVSLYNGAAALAYPSLFEGFGLPILEAFACGCPVITSNLSSMPEVAGGAALFVDPYKEEEIAEAMLKIMKNDKQRNNLIQLGLRRIKEFSWKKAAEQTLKVLEEVVGKHA